jgi:hypothetical protein
VAFFHVSKGELKMPTYDIPQRETYVQPTSAFGATTESMRIIGPKGKKGKVIDFGIDITTAMVGTTSVPELAVGTAQGDSTYGRFRLGTTIAAGYGVGAQRATVVGGNTVTDDSPSFDDYVGHVKLTPPAISIPADTQIFISRVAGVGGAPAGAGASYVIIDWY